MKYPSTVLHRLSAGVAPLRAALLTLLSAALLIPGARAELSTTPTNALTLDFKSVTNLPTGAEILAFDPTTKTMAVTSGVTVALINLTDPAAPGTPIVLPAATFNGDVSSISAGPGYFAVAVIATPDKTQPGKVVFIEPDGDVLGMIGVGANPDHVSFTPDRTKLLVCNEGEISTTADAVGSVSIIDLSGGFGALTVQTAGFTAFDGQEAALRLQGIRIFPGKSASLDLEPEYLAISPDGTTAMVTLQEANALGILDIATATFTDIVPLGLKDWSLPGNELDAGDRDGAGNTVAVNIRNQPVFGMYMPDTIASYAAPNGGVYYVMANEGDDRDDFINPDETIRVGSGSYVLDPTVFPNAATLKSNAQLGRLTVCNLNGLRGDTDNDGDVDQILVYGARSFSIVDANGNRVFDSAGLLEKIVNTITPTFHNADGTAATFDTRSDNKGPEPEGLSVATIGAHTYAFVGLERAGGGVAVFDITDPTSPIFTNYTRRDGDLNPEGLLNIPAAQSPNGENLLVVTNEVSNTVTVYQVNTEIDYTLQVLHFYAETGLLGVETAPIMGALIEKFEDQFANTLVLAEGDTFIPGPWLIAGADPSLNPIPGIGSTALGRPDIAILNAFGTDASALGNHEFDLGSPVFQAAIQGSGAWVGAQFPFITANLNFAADSALRPLADPTIGGTGASVAGLELSAIPGKIAPYAVSTINGEKIGILGITTFELLSKSSPNGTVPFDDGNPATSDLQEVAIYVQNAVTALQGLGVNKIVMVDQLDTLERNRQLAPLISGVDVMVAGGGHERVGDSNDLAFPFNGHDATFSDTFPIVEAGLDGKPILIVTTDTEFTYLGRLVVDFNAAGEIILPSLNPGINGAYAAVESVLQEAYNTTDSAATIVAASTIGSKVAAIANAINGIVVAKDGNVFGYTNVYLEGDRVFGRTQEVNLGNLAADSNAIAAKGALGLSPNAPLVSLKNGGAIRASIGSVAPDGTKTAPIASSVKPAGAISQLDVENALRFNNPLMVFDVTPQELLNILNFAASLSSNLNQQNGGYPQVGGLQFSYDPSIANPNPRVKNVTLVDSFGAPIATVVQDGVVVPGAPALIPFVTANFTAQGGDSYPMKANGANFRYVLADGTVTGPVSEGLDFTAAINVPANVAAEQKTLEDYLRFFHPNPAQAFNQMDTPAPLDTRIQILTQRADGIELAPSDITLAPGIVRESNAPGASVGTLSAVDANAGATVSFALVSGDGDTDNGSFSVDGTTLRIHAVADFENQPSYSVRIRATDNTGLFFEESFTVSVMDVTVEPFLVASFGAAVPGAGVEPNIPAGSTWQNFGVPSINDSGKVAFLGTVKSGSKTFTGIFTGFPEFPETHKLIAKKGDAAPELANVVYSSFKDPMLAANGAVAFVATLGNAPGTTGNVATANNQVIILDPDGDGSLPAVLVARKGDAAVGIPEQSGPGFSAIARYSTFNSVVLGESSVAFTATLVSRTGTSLPAIPGPGNITGPNNFGIWIYQAGTDTLQLALRETDPLLGSTVKTISALTSRMGSPGQGRGLVQIEGAIGTSLERSTNHVDQLTLRVTLADGRHAIGKIDSNLNATYDYVRDGLAITNNDITTPPWASFGLPTQSLSGGLAFVGTVKTSSGGPTTANNVAIYAENDIPAELSSVVRKGDEAPGVGGSKFSGFQDPVAGDAGTVAFRGTLATSSSLGISLANNVGIWWRDEIGDVELVARKGSVAPGALASGTPPSGEPTPKFNTFSSVAIPGFGYGPLFVGQLINKTGTGTGASAQPGPGGVTPANDIGLWATDTEGNVLLLLREGDPIADRTVKSFTVLSGVLGSPAQTRSFNRAGNVVLRVIDNLGKAHLIVLSLPE